MLNDHSKTLHWFGQSIKKKVTKQHGVDHGWYREKVLSIYGAGTFISMSPKSFSLLCSFVHMELCYNAIVEGLRERTEHLDIFLFFCPSLNGVLFPMFCLLVEGDCQILVF